MNKVKDIDELHQLKGLERIEAETQLANEIKLSKKETKRKRKKMSYEAMKSGGEKNARR